MNIEDFREYCIAKKGVTEDFPFDKHALVFKVLDKMFALTNIDTFESINLKCDPEQAIKYREEHSAIIPGYHMNKKHWNTVLMDGTLGDNFLAQLIDHSYDLVVQKLPKKDRERLKTWD